MARKHVKSFPSDLFSWGLANLAWTFQAQVLHYKTLQLSVLPCDGYEKATSMAQTNYFGSFQRNGPCRIPTPWRSLGHYSYCKVGSHTIIQLSMVLLKLCGDGLGR
jgi:hypothetical protein